MILDGAIPISIICCIPEDICNIASSPGCCQNMLKTSTKIQFREVIPELAIISSECASGSGGISGSMMIVQSSHGYESQSKYSDKAVSNRVSICAI